MPRPLPLGPGQSGYTRGEPLDDGHWLFDTPLYIPGSPSLRDLEELEQSEGTTGGCN